MLVRYLYSHKLAIGSPLLSFQGRAAGLYCSGMGKITRGRGGQRYKGLVIRLLVVFTLVQSWRSCSVQTAVYGYSHWNFTITDTASLLLLPTKYKCKWSILLSEVWQDRNPDWLSSRHQLQQNWWIRNISLQARLVANLSQRARSSKNIGVLWSPTVKFNQAAPQSKWFHSNHQGLLPSNLLTPDRYQTGLWASWML